MRLDNRLVEALEGIADGLPLPGGLQKVQFLLQLQANLPLSFLLTLD